MIRFACMLLLVGALLVLSGLVRPRGTALRRHIPEVHPLAVAGGGLAGASIALVLTAIPIVAVLAMFAGGAVPFVLQRRRAERRVRDAMQAWPGIIDDITSAVRAGMDLPEALRHAGTRAPIAMQPAFHACTRRYAMSGDFRSALQVMCETSPDPVLAQLTQALVITRDVGGTDLTQVLRSLGSFVRADLQLRGELAARQSWSVNSARMAVAAPWIVLVMLAARPSTAVAYRSPSGMVVLLAVALLSATAYALMLRIATLETA